MDISNSQSLLYYKQRERERGGGERERERRERERESLTIPPSHSLHRLSATQMVKDIHVCTCRKNDTNANSHLAVDEFLSREGG